MTPPDLTAVAIAWIAQAYPDVGDPRKLKPGELCRLLNSTPRGQCLDDRQLRAHRSRAGLRIGDAEGKTVDLIRYAAWLAGEWRPPGAAAKEPVSTETPPADGFLTGYALKKERERARNAAASRTGRDIGPLPPVADPHRRAKGVASFRFFCETYFADRFHIAWSDDHLKVIQRIEGAVLGGGLFALAMPRGSGKTSLCEVACVWAPLAGHRSYVAFIGASADAAKESLESVKTELETNELLIADFPEVCFPLARLEGRANLCAGQHQEGRRTRITWGKSVVVLPTVASSKSSGAILRVAGITGRVRGMKHTKASGESIRPDLVIVDDPQTDRSAHSTLQCTRRERVLAGAVLGLAGPREKIAGIMPCTVIRPGDVADNILNRDLHPEWQGERCKLLYAMPANMQLWDEYAVLRADELRNGGDGSQATAWYGERRDEMDAGAIEAWPERHNSDELSALQHALNLYYTDPVAFASEYQNTPLLEDLGDGDLLRPEQIATKTNSLARRVVPAAATLLTGFVDVQKNMLFWLIAAWRDDFTGAIVDYGAWPDQQIPYFAYRTARHTLAAAYPKGGTPAKIYAGLSGVVELLLGREWPRENGSVARIDRLIVDANFESDTVYKFCRESKHAAILLPSHGKGIGASGRPMSEYKRKPGERVGQHWVIPEVQRKRVIRYVLIDANFWKSFVHARLATERADTGSLELFGGLSQAARPDHRLLSEHLTAEYAVRVTGRGRTVDEWHPRPNQEDNHWLDCLVGAAAAASIQGASLVEHQFTPGQPAGPQIKFSDVVKAKKLERQA